MKPMLASDFNENKIRFPVLAQPKIDGVRGLNIDGTLVGRSLKRHANRFTTYFYSLPSLSGLDGELAAECETHPRLCSLTSSALSTVEGHPFTLWWLFDLVNSDTEGLAYATRYSMLKERVTYLQKEIVQGQYLRVVPSILVHDREELQALESMWLEEGYEGVILRDPAGKHKQGRSTVREGGLLRIKRFVEEEAIVLSIIEGRRNENAAQVNELGKTFRTSHAENMVPNGMVGSMLCLDVKTQKEITVAAGCMTDEEALYYFRNPGELIGQTIKYKSFPKGVKDKPRFPTFQAIKGAADQ